MWFILFFFFFFNDTATTEIYTLSLHDALPISRNRSAVGRIACDFGASSARPRNRPPTMRISGLAGLCRDDARDRDAAPASRCDLADPHDHASARVCAPLRHP